MHPEIPNNPPQQTHSEYSTHSTHSTHSTDSKRSALNTLSTLVFYIAILFFIIGFNFSDVMVGNWQQQFLPNLNGRAISDICFIDSVNGWAVTPYTTQNDSVFIMRTTNRGDDWFIQFSGTAQFPGMKKIIFINTNTGYCCGNFLYNGSTQLVKTTNSGINWFSLNTPDPFFVVDDMQIISEDTIYLAVSSPSSGGVFFTSNGGSNWVRQASLGPANPDHIYMYNSRIGFAGQFSGAPRLFKTTNSGMNWFSLNDTGFTDMYFADSLTGWMSMGWMKKTTNGGLNWIRQTLPSGGNIITTGISRFVNINRDTIWGVGGWVFYPGNGNRGILYRTTNQGTNWLYQIPDTSIHIPVYSFPQFINKNIGWVYASGIGGIHTTNGGDTNFIVGLQQVSNEMPKEYMLYQNYPNPFNPNTNIKYQIRNNRAKIRLSVFDVTGKHIIDLVDQEQNAGTYEVDFSGSGYASGVYFYKLTVTFAIGGRKEVFTETRKMLLIK
ncbi:MAG: T9SS type A sorting domain-containing protein [Ignavibacteria bacterium]|nr:T9SS type A sorting domain-containing protein [Ignavibacteria bacterium]